MKTTLPLLFVIAVLASLGCGSGDGDSDANFYVDHCAALISNPDRG